MGMNKIQKKFIADVTDSKKLAAEFFGDKATPEIAFRLFDLVPVPSDGEADHEEGREALQVSLAIAKQIFGDDVSPDVTLEVFERVFCEDEDDDGDDE